MLAPYALALHGALSTASGDGSAERLIIALTNFEGACEPPPALGSVLEGPCDDSQLVPEAVFLRFPHLAARVRLEHVLLAYILM